MQALEHTEPSNTKLRRRMKMLEERGIYAAGGRTEKMLANHP